MQKHGNENKSKNTGEGRIEFENNNEWAPSQKYH